MDVAQVMIPTIQSLGVDHDTFFDEAFASYLLGDVLWNLDRDPLVGVVTKEVFRSSFPAIHELFTRPGTFEFYLSVFRKIFSADVDIEFEIPGPGQLVINVSAITYENFGILTREIVDDVYVYSNLVTSDLNEPIVGQGVVGIKTQAEMEGLISEISAYGVYTEINLVTPP